MMGTVVLLIHSFVRCLHGGRGGSGECIESVDGVVHMNKTVMIMFGASITKWTHSELAMN